MGMNENCTDDHSSGQHCPLHGYDDSVPAPEGFTWHQVVRDNGAIYSALVCIEPIGDVAVKES